MAHKFIAVAGNIGCGKSSMVQFLCRHYGLETVLESREANPYFDDFYKDMRRYAFPFQLSFLVQKFQKLKELEAHSGVMLLDRTIYEDAEIFARNLYVQGIMDKRDFETYLTLYQTMLGQLRAPDLLVYLECPLNVMKKRIHQRGVLSEQNIPDDYLKALQRLYRKWIDHYSGPIIRYPTDKLDYLSDFLHRQDLLEKIGETLSLKSEVLQEDITNLSSLQSVEQAS